MAKYVVLADNTGLVDEASSGMEVSKVASSKEEASSIVRTFLDDFYLNLDDISVYELGANVKVFTKVELE